MKSFKILFLGVSLIFLSISKLYANEIGMTVPEFTQAQNIEISRTGDHDLSCNALSKEAGHMMKIMHRTQDIKNNSDLKSHGVTAAGAIGSLLIGSATGGVGLALGSFLMNHNIDDARDRADTLNSIAAQRRTLMMGIHNAKGCFGPVEHAMQNPPAFDPIDHIARNYNNKNYTELRRRYND